MEPKWIWGWPLGKIIFKDLQVWVIMLDVRHLGMFTCSTWEWWLYMRKQSRICQDFTSMNNLKLQKIGKITQFSHILFGWVADVWTLNDFFHEEVASTNKMKLGMCKGGWIGKMLGKGQNIFRWKNRMTGLSTSQAIRSWRWIPMTLMMRWSWPNRIFNW